MAGGIADERQLEEFGYKQELPRVLRLWTNWAIGFAFISPIVGLYTVVALGAATGRAGVGVERADRDRRRYTVNIGIACEAIASVGIGIALILFFRQQPVSVLTDTGGVADGGSYLPAFVAAVAIAGWVLLGFDACGSVAEETRDAARQVPKAIVMSLVGCGGRSPSGTARRCTRRCSSPSWPPWRSRTPTC